jgi:hypothetical protein
MRYCIWVYLPRFQLGFERYLVEFGRFPEYLVFDPKYVHYIASILVPLTISPARCHQRSKDSTTPFPPCANPDPRTHSWANL